MLRRNFEKITFALLAFIGVVLIGGVLWFYFQANRFTTFEHPIDEFSIKYPTEWVKKENYNGTSVLFQAPLETELDIFQENVNVVVQYMRDEKMNLQKYTKMALDQMQFVFKDYMQIVASEPSYLSRKPGHLLEFYGYGEGGVELKYKILWTIKDGVAYQITFVAWASEFDKYENKVDAMIKSFKIKRKKK